MLDHVAALGRRTRHAARDSMAALQFVGATLRATVALPSGARALSFGTALRQIYFTAVQALPMVSTVALLLGLVVIAQARAQSVKLGVASVLGDLLATVLVRDLGPLFTAIIVVGRSATAIATEIATCQALGELRALDALGVDPLQLLVPPRVFAAAVSLAVLTLTFDALALLGGMIGSAWLVHLSPADYLRSVQHALLPGDVIAVMSKAALLGTGIACVACFAGLRARLSTAEIPRSVTRGVVYALVFVFIASGALTAMPLLWGR